MYANLKVGSLPTSSCIFFNLSVLYDTDTEKWVVADSQDISVKESSGNTGNISQESRQSIQSISPSTNFGSEWLPFKNGLARDYSWDHWKIDSFPLMYLFTGLFDCKETAHNDGTYVFLQQSQHNFPNNFFPNF